MSVETVKSLIRMGGGRRALNWKDERGRSPKALNDMSGIILSNVTTKGAPAIQEFDYELLSKVFICNDLAWTCINLVSSTAALAKLKVRIKDKDGDITYLPDHPLQKVLDFPNASMTQFDLIQAYVTHQLLFGTVSMMLLRADMVEKCPLCIADGSDECLHKLYYFRDSPVEQIMPVHPSNLEQLYVNGSKQKLFFYVPDLGVNRKFPIHPDNLFTDPYYNPDVSWYGVSPTFLLMRWLELDQSMTGQITSFFDNGAIPSMIVSLKPGTNYTYDTEPDNLVEMMKQKWTEQFRKGGKSEKAPAFVYGDIQVERVQEKIEENVGKNLYYEIQNRVCATYGVPPALYEMGLKYGGPTATGEQSEKDFYNRTISKILARFEKKINQLLVPSYKTEGLEVAWDLSEMGIASFLVDKKETRIVSHWEKGLIKRAQAQLMLGYDADNSELGDDYYRITVMGDGQGNKVTNQLTPASDNNLTPATDASSSNDKVSTVKD